MAGRGIRTLGRAENLWWQIDQNCEYLSAIILGRLLERIRLPFCLTANGFRNSDQEHDEAEKDWLRPSVSQRTIQYEFGEREVVRFHTCMV